MQVARIKFVCLFVCCALICQFRKTKFEPSLVELLLLLLTCQMKDFPFVSPVVVDGGGGGGDDRERPARRRRRRRRLAH